MLRRTAAVELIGRLLNAEYVAWLEASPEGEWQCEHERCPAAGELNILRNAAFNAVRTFKAAPRSECMLLDDRRQIVVNQICKTSGSESLLVAVVPATLNASFVSSVQRLVALDLTASQPQPGSERNGSDNQTSAAALGLAVRLASAADATAGAKMLGGLGLSARSCRARRRRTCGSQSDDRKVMAASSDVEHIDRHAESVRLVEDCMTAPLSHGRVVSWTSGSDCPTGLANWLTLAEQWNAGSLTAIQIVDRESRTIAVCLLLQQQPLPSRKRFFFPHTRGQVAGPLMLAA